MLPGGFSSSRGVDLRDVNAEGQYWVVAQNEAGSVTSGVWQVSVTLKGETTLWGDTDFGDTNTYRTETNLVAVAAGAVHTLALREDGTVLVWGQNGLGQTNAPGDLTNVVAIAAGLYFNLTVKEDGTVVGWGDNSSGQVTIPDGLTNVVAVAAGGSHSLALRRDGTVAGWGPTWYGAVPPSDGCTNVMAIAAGGSHSLALHSNGTVTAWGWNGEGQCTVPTNLSNVLAIAGGWDHSLALKSDGTVVGWGYNAQGQCVPPADLTNAMRIAAGYRFSLATCTDGRIVAWGLKEEDQTNVPTGLGDTYAVSAGAYHAAAIAYNPILDYPVDPAQDLLLVCNTNSADSTNLLAYYLERRPMVGNANTLGIGCPAIETWPTREQLTNELIAPVRSWLRDHPAKRPRFIVLMYGIPSRVNDTNPPGNATSASVSLRGAYPVRRPFVTLLNMRTYEDCTNYVNKLAHFGTNYSPGRVYISASRGGYGNTNYVFDDTRVGYDENSAMARYARDGVLTHGAPTQAVLYADAWYEDWQTNPPTQIHGGTNLAGYMSWGQHGQIWSGLFTNGYIGFFGNTAWFLIQTVESFNGWWDPSFYAQNTFHDWFSRRAFVPLGVESFTPYQSTAVGAVSHTDEPQLSGVPDPYSFFGLWQAGKSFGLCAWQSQRQRTPKFQATGDPFVKR